MIRIIRKYSLGFILYAGFLLTGSILLVSVPKLELHVLLNSGHSPGSDAFFRFFTWLGNGWFAAIFSLLFLFVRYRYSLMLMGSFAVSGGLAQFLKRVFFPGVLRPAAYLDQMPGLELVNGVDLYHTLGFPSGHTTTAFAVLVLTGFLINRRYAVLAGMLAAILAGLSRVYLSQHFLIDVLAGSLIGVFSALFFYWYFRNFKSAWMDRSLIGVIRKKNRD